MTFVVLSFHYQTLKALRRNRTMPLSFFIDKLAQRMVYDPESRSWERQSLLHPLPAQSLISHSYTSNIYINI